MNTGIQFFISKDVIFHEEEFAFKTDFKVEGNPNATSSSPEDLGFYLFATKSLMLPRSGLEDDLEGLNVTIKNLAFSEQHSPVNTPIQNNILSTPITLRLFPFLIPFLIFYSLYTLF